MVSLTLIWPESKIFEYDLPVTTLNIRTSRNRPADLFGGRTPGSAFSLLEHAGEYYECNNSSPLETIFALVFLLLGE